MTYLLTLLKQFDRFRCHLAGSLRSRALVESNGILDYCIMLDGVRGPLGKERFEGFNPPSQNFLVTI